MPSGKIQEGRSLVEAYRIAHRKLYERGQRKGIPQEHTPILHILQNGLTGLGFEDLNDFFSESELFNIQSLGYENRLELFGTVDEKGDYIIEPKSTQAERGEFERMWK